MASLEALLSVLTPAQIVDALHEEADGGDTQGEGNRHRGDLVLLSFDHVMVGRAWTEGEG